MMMTWVLDRDWKIAASLLDDARLDKQVRDLAMVTRVIERPWLPGAKMPTVAMWRDEPDALRSYREHMVAEWGRRFSTSGSRSSAIGPPVAPSWFDQIDRVVASHRERLAWVYPGHYGNLWLSAPARRELFWPEPKQVEDGAARAWGCKTCRNDVDGCGDCRRFRCAACQQWHPWTAGVRLSSVCADCARNGGF